MDKLKVNIIMEVLGRPPEHIKEAIAALVDKLGSEKGVKIVDKKIHEPTPVRDSKDLFITFAELSMDIDSLSNLFGIMFAYMPANVEVVSPENFTLSNIELNDLANRLMARLHDYDAITKKFVYERNFLLGKLREVAPGMFKNLQEAPKVEEKKDEEKKESKKAKKSKD